jgi:hypothetical protein
LRETRSTWASPLWPGTVRNGWKWRWPPDPRGRLLTEPTTLIQKLNFRSLRP